jgi:hypothetical protein
VGFLALIFLADRIPELGINTVNADSAVKHGRLLPETGVKPSF